MATKKAVVLLSGGLDSATAAALARQEGHELYGLTVTYGQVHLAEIDAARRIAKSLEIAEHRILDVPFGQWGGSALVKSGSGADQDRPAIPLDRRPEQMAGEIPVTYVPARNTIFLSLALGWAEAIKAEAIYLGVNALDYSGYPDCRPEYLQAFDQMARLATKEGVEKGVWPRLRAPLVTLTKAQIIRKGLELGVDYSLTHSCYQPDAIGRACGRCDSCQIRLRGFAELGLKDPAIYS